MKKLLLLLLIPFFTDAQSLMCRFKIVKNDTVASDTLTLVTIHNMTRNSKYTTYTHNTGFYLDNTCEYMLTFTREKCKTKQVYVTPMELSSGRNYDALIEIPMEEGKEEQHGYLGTVWYDRMLDTVRNKIR